MKKRQEGPTFNPLQLTPVGIIKRIGQRPHIKIYPRFRKALDGLKSYSRIIVLWWCDRNDSPRKRRRLKVHPMGDRTAPLQGIFATRSPVRPNPIALSVCSLIKIEGDILTLDEIDAFDDTPVIDIKPCVGREEEGAVAKRL